MLRDKRQKAAREGREKSMNKLKDSILSEATNGGSWDISNASNDANNTTTSATTFASNDATRSSENYIYGIGIVTLLAIDVCVFVTYNKASSQTMKK